MLQTRNECAIDKPYNPSLLERLKEREARAKYELEKVQKAIKALEDKPEIAEIFEAINGALY